MTGTILKQKGVVFRNSKENDIVYMRNLEKHRFKGEKSTFLLDKENSFSRKQRMP